MIENREVWRRQGSRIAEMRRSRGLTQFQLAEMTGLSESYIGFLEQGIRNGTILTYLDIVTALGYSLNDLVDVHRAEIPSELALELSDFFTACTMDEVRIFSDLRHICRPLHSLAGLFVDKSKGFMVYFSLKLNNPKRGYRICRPKTGFWCYYRHCRSNLTTRPG